MRTEKMSDSGRLQALGNYLRGAREEQEYSVAEVAERLFLSSNQVLAIEEARYDALPAEVFVKGYLRAYAKLLDLDPEEVIKQYQPVQVVPAPRPVVTEESPSKRLLERMPELPDTSTTLVLGALAALVVLFLASVIYFASGGSDEPVVEPDAAGEPATEQAADAGDIAGQAAVQTDGNVDSDALVMRFSDDCWVEVRDASRKILLADMRRAGDTEIVQGDPPYKVVFGKSSAVAVRFQGQRVPVEAESGKLSAQMVIGG